jgi:hypothetical protein
MIGGFRSNGVDFELLAIMLGQSGPVTYLEASIAAFPVEQCNAMLKRKLRRSELARQAAEGSGLGLSISRCNADGKGSR